MRYDFFHLNDLLSKKLQSGEPFSCLRIDNTAGYVMECLHRGDTPTSQFYNEHTLIEGGVYPNTMDYAYNTVIPMTHAAMKKCDILGFVDMSESISRNHPFVSEFGEKVNFFGHNDMLIMDPGALLNVTGQHYVETPWTTYLKGKKVLVISTHAETILHQWNNIDKVWGDKRDTIAPFDLVGIIKSPYHPLMDERQYPGCDTWDKTVDFIMQEIRKYDFDVLLTSSTTSSPIYAVLAAEMGKVGIQTGGVLQLWFGILGYRWSVEANNGYRPWAAMYNEHWMYPLQQDEPANRNNYAFLETNYAYWKR